MLSELENCQRCGVRYHEHDIQNDCSGFLSHSQLREIAVANANSAKSIVRSSEERRVVAPTFVEDTDVVIANGTPIKNRRIYTDPRRAVVSDLERNMLLSGMVSVEHVVTYHMNTDEMAKLNCPYEPFSGVFHIIQPGKLIIDPMSGHTYLDNEAWEKIQHKMGQL